MTDVSVVVVSCNAREVLELCLDAVVRPGREVVVVDNASSDGSADLVRSRSAGVRLIALDENLGYGTAANIGIRATTGRYVLVLNADAWPMDDAIERLVDYAERAPRVALLGTRLVGIDGTPQRSVIRQPGCLALPIWTVFPRLGSGAYTAWRRVSAAEPKVRASEFVIGAALLLRREAFEEIGGFDESFFMYNEDADLCFRFRRAGWRIEILSSATFVHVGGASSGSIPEEMYRELLRSHLRFRAKYGSDREADFTRRLLVGALRLRAAAGGGERERSAADWLAATETAELLGGPG